MKGRIYKTDKLEVIKWDWIDIMLATFNILLALLALTVFMGVWKCN